MSCPLNWLAIDLGAESGRALLGTLCDRRLQLREVHRFPNGPVAVPEIGPGKDGLPRQRLALHWDVLRLWSEIRVALARTAREVALTGGALAGIGIDTWGVDFALLDAQGALLQNPYHYRDARTDGMIEAAFARMSRSEIFAHTGIQVMPINSLYQLMALVAADSPVLRTAQTFLTIPDLFNYWLTGRQVCEFTNATTTQCYDPRARAWSGSLLEGLGIPAHIFPEVVPAGTVLGPLLPALAEETGLGPVPVIAPACHDTGSAVAAVPAEGAPYVWISSGTWSILGTDLPAPLIDEHSLAYNFTNEGGIGGSFRFSKNVTGLWLLQECRRTWAAQGHEETYAHLTELAAHAAPFVAVIDPDHPDFLKPGDMPSRIVAHCRATGQHEPQDRGEIVRCILESIALKYRWVLARLEESVGRSLGPIHIVGGGTQNHLLSQFTADATQRRVIAGPIEATATGNVLVQALALGHLSSPSEVRAIVRDSSALMTYEPGQPARWDAAYARLEALVAAAA